MPGGFVAWCVTVAASQHHRGMHITVFSVVLYACTHRLLNLSHCNNDYLRQGALFISRVCCLVALLEALL